ncbi:hypothetical protein [Microbulbifer guangxiensis]|uniref:hypothetical protein n=1 Tax=Microbulbifer guangxiensis TaxID=2904249 RepID=UPI001F3A6F6C|nr:hypothetical protein [Microbulbifer guangxiensis]
MWQVSRSWETRKQGAGQVEKIVEKSVEKIVEKEVPDYLDECIQIRRNAKIYVSGDGVAVDGAPTIGESRVENIPELVPAS